MSWSALTRICTPENMHPYECDGPGHCRHCDRRRTTSHNPATCALCDEPWPPEQEDATADRPEDLPIPPNADRRYEETDGG